ELEPPPLRRIRVDLEQGALEGQRLRGAPARARESPHGSLSRLVIRVSVAEPSHAPHAGIESAELVLVSYRRTAGRLRRRGRSLLSRGRRGLSLLSRGRLRVRH